MSFAPPPGPPPPVVPEGWKPQFDDRYKQWFFVNLRTGKSQWEPPQGPAKGVHTPPSEAPPSYEESGTSNLSAPHGTNEKKSFGSNNPFNQAGARNSSLESDARLAAQLQAEEDARARGSRSPGQQTQPGAAADYYAEASRPQSVGYQSSPAPSQQSSGPEQKRSKGFLSKLMGKASSGGGASYGKPSQPPQSYGHPPGGYGGYSQQPAGYGYPAYPSQPGYYPTAAQPARRHGGGVGTAGAAALGVGGGLLGGALLASALDDHHDYNDCGGGYDDFDGGDFGDF
ncbi:hypothetical protein BDV28DRAFT_143732 [Aspergillus coremiiformis]|uniref:WW domain-containing protein n=1 Tax=Aspergillus coremiiformis TaxID=138285 RepID=A0A5N6YXE2_9EURO|nr:hypothetical protein BDV28DRAFT_143732 [Aspergillus coremiiformis]